MKWNKIKEVFKERWKFYLAGYIIGYFASLINNGIQGWKTLFPIKLSYIICGVLIGTAFFYATKKTPVFETVYKSIKYCLFIIVLIGIFAVVRVLVLQTTGNDISFLMEI